MVATHPRYFRQNPAKTTTPTNMSRMTVKLSPVYALPLSVSVGVLRKNGGCGGWGLISLRNRIYPSLAGGGIQHTPEFQENGGGQKLVHRTRGSRGVAGCLTAYLSVCLYTRLSPPRGGTAEPQRNVQRLTLFICLILQCRHINRATQGGY